MHLRGRARELYSARDSTSFIFPGLSESVAFELVLHCWNFDKCSGFGRSIRERVLSVIKTDILSVAVSGCD